MTMKEEEIIRHYDTGGNPFRTPDGYFEGFTSRLMERMEREGLTATPAQIPEQQKTTSKVVKMNPIRRALRYAAAAVLAGICVGTGTYLYMNQSSTDQMMAADAMELLSEETLEQAFDYEADYEMLDNSQIAYYLTEAY